MADGYWLVALPSQDFEAARAARTLPLAHLGAAAKEVHPGDRVAIYLSDLQAFAATADVTDDRMRFDAACPANDYEPAAPLVRHLDVLKGSRPRPGDAQRISERDWEQVRFSCRGRERGRPRPLGAPPTEAEKRPPIPPKLKKPSGRLKKPSGRWQKPR